MDQLSLFQAPEGGREWIYQTHVAEWRGRSIEVRYCPDWGPSALMKEFYGHGLAHLTVRAIDGQPLPVTSTGFMSLFNRPDVIVDPVAFTLEWMETAPKRKAESPEGLPALIDATLD